MNNNLNVNGTWTTDDNMFSGRWINKNTGQKITKSNSIIDNNEMILMTSIGQMTMDEWSRDYIQYIDEEPAVSIKESKPLKNTSIQNNISTELVEDYMLPEDKVLLTGTPVIQKTPMDNVNTITTTTISSIPNKNNEVLEKFFKDNTVKTDIHINFDFNEDELKTIMKYMNININDITEYVYENIINKDTIKEQISNIILNKLN